MARERSIVVRLKAEVADFQRQMGSASRTLTDFEREQQKMGGAATTTMGRLVQSAKINRQEWETVGRTLATAGAAVTGLGVAALKVGVDYNSLRQSATQSLTAVTGSTEEAAAQMKRLDDFGQNSWLMRDTLVRAQQQMTGFGISTEKVIPYMDGLAEAVAAAGGSNQDFEELAGVMGKVQSQGKLTARELEQFGVRGIDAAQMIGNAMGTTADDIRSQITAGTLDAETALDALAEGMKTTFEGSSALVRDSFSGAMDNAKAAFRDLMAEIAKPLVDPEGGGFLVDMANNAADFINKLRELPEPLKITAGAISGLAGVGALAMGSFLLLFPRIVAVGEALRTLSRTAPGAVAALRGIGAAAGPVALTITAVTGLIAAMETLNKVEVPEYNAAEFTEGILNATSAAEQAQPAFNEFFQLQEKGYWNATEGLDSFEDALLRVFDKNVHETLRDAMSWLPGISSADLEAAEQGLAGLDGALAGMVQSGNAERAEEAWDEMSDRAAALGITTDELMTMFPQYAEALKDAENQTRLAGEETSDFADEARSARDALRQQRQALDELTEALLESANTQLSAREADIKYQRTLAETRSNIKENNKVLAESEEGTKKHTEALLANEEELNNLASSMLDKIKTERDAGTSTTQLRVMTEEMRGEFIKSAEQTGLNKSAAEGLADALGLIPDNVSAKVGVTGIPGAMSAIDRLNRTLNTINGKTVTAAVAVKQYGQAAVADGGFTHGGVLESFAHGGVRGSLPNRAVIQSPRQNLVQWAEPETGGEAFIPLAPAKRARSLKIWEETGRRLGALPRSFANGGFNLPLPAPVYSAATQAAGHTINVYGVETDSTSEVAKAVLFASRKHDRGGVHNRRS